MSDNDVPTYGYEYGIDPLVEIGKIRAFGKRILARAILRTDAYDVQNGGTLHTVASNSSDAEAFVVISVGGQVEKWCLANGDMPPQVGDHIECASVAADRVGSDPTGRYWMINIEDVTGVITPVAIDDAELIEACMRAKAKREMVPAAPAPDNGERLIMAR
jgi:hypothetical protein